MNLSTKFHGSGFTKSPGLGSAMSQLLAKTLLLVALVLSLGTATFAQTLYDSFADGNFSSNPVWGGTTSTWEVVASSDAAAGATGSNTLRLKAAATTGTEYLSSQVATWGVSQEWNFWVGRRAQAYTAANQMYIWLYANEATLTNLTVDGYRLAVGDDTGNDEIRLEYIVNGALSSTVITSTGAFANGLTDIGYLVRVTRSSTGQWALFTSTLPTVAGTGAIATDVPSAANTSVAQGTATHNTIVPAANGYIGVGALHSTGANAIIAVEFDQAYFTATAGGGGSGPTVDSPTATTFTTSSAVLGATVVSDNGSAVTERGTVYSTSTPVLVTDNPLAEGGTALGAYSHTRSGLSPQTKYYYKGYALNANGTGLSGEANFYTYSNPPTAASGSMTATAATSSSINLTWTDGAYPASGATTNGYIILRSSTGTPALVAAPNGLAPASVLAAGTTLVGTVTAANPALPATAFTATGLTAGVTYTFTVMPYTFDGTNAGTYNYLTAGAPTASGMTAATTYTWSGGSGSWADAANWSPSAVPGSGDAVIFSVTGTAVVSNVPTISLTKLHITSGDVSFTAAAAQTITIAGAIAPELSVAAGTTFQLAGANGITVNLNAANTGVIDGTVIAKQGAHRLQGTDASSVIFSSTGSFSAGFTGTTGYAGNPFGNSGTANTVVFQSGATFTQLEGSNPFALTAPLSKVNFMAGSNFHFGITPSGTPSLSGRTYPNLFIENTTGVVSTAASSFVVEDLHVASGSSFSLTGSGTQSNTVKGNIVADGVLTLVSGSGGDVFPAGTHTISGTAATVTMNRISVPTGSTLTLQHNIVNATSTTVDGTLDFGTAALTGAGSFTTNSGAALKIGHANGLGTGGNLQTTGTKTFNPNTTYTFNGAAPQISGSAFPAIAGTVNVDQKVTLSADLAVTTALNLTQILNSDTHTTALGATTTLTRTATSWVAGKLAKPVDVGTNSSHTFEIGGFGTGEYYAPVTVLFANVTTAGVLTARTVSADHDSIALSAFDATHSVNRHWTVSNTGIVFDNYNLTANWDAADEDMGFDLATAFGGKYNGTSWAYPICEDKTSHHLRMNTLTSFSDFQVANCSGGALTFYSDGDGDGYGSTTGSVQQCAAPAGYIATGGDCNDADNTIHPGADDNTCNSIDENCSGTADEGYSQTYYTDGDGDTYGDAPVTGGCTAPSGTVSVNGDCNDTNANIHPGATEICNGLDDDCDGQIDEGVSQTYYADADGDGYGNPSMSQSGACTAPTGYVSDNTDCNDADNTVHPGAADNTCNNVDNDCDGSIDEDVSMTYYADTDGDTYGNPNLTVNGGCTAPTGATANNTDCNDGDASIHPGATEICGDGIDQNCDGMDIGVTDFGTTITYNCLLATKHTVVVNNIMGGQTPFQYSKDGGATYQMSATFLNVSGGTYTFVVQDASGCTKSKTVIVNALLSVSTTATPISCYGMTNGSATALPTGGSPAYTYNWAKGTTPAGTTQTISNLTAGAYKVTVTDANSCTRTASATITQPSVLKSTLAGINVSCNGGSNGTINQTVSGGTQPYSFAWNDGATSQNRSNIMAGAYTVSVTDNRGCLATATKTLTQPTAITITLTKKDVLCYGGATGSATALAAGGTGTKTYVWNTGATTGTISLLSANSYTVTATDNNGCTKTGSVTVNEPALLEITNIASAPSGSSYTVTVTGAGGVTPYKYRRTTTGTTYGAYNTTGIFLLVAAGTYTFELSDKNKCTTTQVATIGGTVRPTNDDRSKPQTADYQSFELVPNPAHGSVALVFDGAMPTDAQVQIRNAAGRLLFQQRLGNERLELAGLPAGVLFVSVSAEGKLPMTKRLVVLGE